MLLRSTSPGGQAAKVVDSERCEGLDRELFPFRDLKGIEVVHRRCSADATTVRPHDYSGVTQDLEHCRLPDLVLFRGLLSADVARFVVRDHSAPQRLGDPSATPRWLRRGVNGRLPSLSSGVEIDPGEHYHSGPGIGIDPGPFLISVGHMLVVVTAAPRRPA